GEDEVEHGRGDKPGNREAPSKVPLNREQWLSLTQSLEQASDDAVPAQFKNYKYWLIKPNARNLENQSDTFEQRLLHEFASDPLRNEESRHVPSEQRMFAYHAVRAMPGCLTAGCHPLSTEKPLYKELKSGDLMALVKIQIPTDAIESGVHENRALLLAT